MSHLFVYGTLMVPEVAQKIFGKTSEEKAILRNFKRLKIFFNGKELFYPALIEEQKACTEGILFRNVSPQELNLIDFYEGHEYERKLVQVQTQEKTLEAWCYLWKANNAFVLKDEWNLEKFRNEYLDMFLADRL